MRGGMSVAFSSPSPPLSLASVPRFDKSTTWTVWSRKFISLMALQGIVDLSAWSGASKDGGTGASGSCSASKTDREAKKKKAEDTTGTEAEVPLDARMNRLLYHALMLALSDDELMMVSAHAADGDGVAVWRTLVSRYESQTRASKAHMRKVLHKTRMGAEEEFDMYRARLQHSVHRLRDMGESVSDGELLFCLFEPSASTTAGEGRGLSAARLGKAA